MLLTLKIEGMDDVRQALRDLGGEKMRAAQAKALNDTGFHIRRAMQRDLQSAFDRPTPFITRAPKVRMATPDDLSVAIIPTMDTRNLPSKGGKIGVDPQHVLQAQEFGGRRADKRSEVALRRAGILPAGFQTSIPRTPYPGSDDGRGNLRGAFLSQLISYLQASSEQGYRANMTDRRRKALRNQQDIGYISSRKMMKTTLGVRYFVAWGPLRGGGTSHLAPGVWASRGLHDTEVLPVLMFVRLPSYGPRISMQRIAEQAEPQAYLERRLRFRLKEVAGV
jgi:hypothetical protein